MASTSPSILTNVDPDLAEKSTACGSHLTIPGPHQVTSVSKHSRPDQLDRTDLKADGSHWGRDRDRRKLSEDGFRALAICATFLAAVQSQVFSLTATSFPSSDLVTGFFLLGLVTDIIGALLSFASARWFEMLNDAETTFLQECWDEGISAAARHHARSEPSQDVDFMARWVSTSVSVSRYVVILGMVEFILGLMVYVWATQPLATKVVFYFVCGVAILFVPPFAFPHERMKVITHLQFKRRSG